MAAAARQNGSVTGGGELLEFESSVDGLRHPVAVCATRSAGRGEPLPLVLEVSPGALNDLPAAVALTEQIAEFAERAGHAAVVARPTGRGPGSVYQNYGEVDVLEAIEFVAGRWPIDRDRISITGASMGGAATFYLASHYPDLFAAAAPFCGYADYRLWEKPGGLAFALRPWEEPSWRSRSAAYLPENLARTALWMHHGAWDRGVGGGVSVEHSRRIAQLLDGLGIAHRYDEVPRTGHDVRTDERLEAVTGWLLEQRKERAPRRVSHVAYGLRHNVSAWVRVEQQERSGERSLVDASLEGTSRINVRTENVAALSIGPVPGGAHRLTVDGEALGSVGDGATVVVGRDGTGRWAVGPVDLSGRKHHGQSGPVGDLFFDGTLLVVGTIGSDEETFFNEWCATEAAWFYRSRNGGVHRGGIMGLNTVDLPVVKDVDVTDADRTTNNLLCFGTPATNEVLRRYAGALPVAFEKSRIRVGDRTFAAPDATVVAAFPHPEHDGRYVAVHGGVTPDAITWGSHLDLGLLPDYLVYARDAVLDWGFFGEDWRPAG
jgi:pimeloyl-ACP methyl ester carboxylesterase